MKEQQEDVECWGIVLARYILMGCWERNRDILRGETMSTQAVSFGVMNSTCAMSMEQLFHWEQGVQYGLLLMASAVSLENSAKPLKASACTATKWG